MNFKKEKKNVISKRLGKLSVKLDKNFHFLIFIFYSINTAMERHGV